MEILEKDIRYLKYVGEIKAKKLNNLGIYTYKDLLYHYPRTYEDRRTIKKIKDLILGESVIFTGSIIDKFNLKRIRKSLSIMSFYVSDETDKLKVTIFNQAYIKNKLEVGKSYAFYGKIESTVFGFEVVNPVITDIEKTNELKGIYPIYPATSHITSEYIRKLIKEIYKEDFVINEIFNDKFRKENNIIRRNEAMKKIHMPQNMEDISVAKRTLVFEELFMLQLALNSMKNENIKAKKLAKYTNTNIEQFLSILPFELTNAQTRTVDEIIKDMEKNNIPMNRLIEGDVGSGKTIVVAIAMYIAVKNGYQAAMMAPTTILAKQHYLVLKEYFDKLGIKTGILTGSSTKKQKEEIIDKLKNKGIDILFGTHAIIEDNIEFNNISLVITDEQHRFGVKQRLRLSKKNTGIDVIVMTATPIPRTLALLIYSDLDMSIIDEMPKGRKPIKTYIVDDSYEQRINLFVKKELDKKRQTYIVCPLIEESEQLDLTAAKSIYEKYRDDIFRDYRVGFLNGKMKNKEKDEVMNEFKNGEIDILVSTTVIEVGVDVKNATIMIIEDASRFGLSTLHQLRGRVGRSDMDSYCILKTKIKSKQVMERLEIMTKSNNGLEIASKDLELRGPGDFFGTKQHGLPEFKIANVVTDISILKETSKLVKDLLKTDSRFLNDKNNEIKKELDKYIKSGIIYS